MKKPKPIDYYAGKASARAAACTALNEALGNLAAAEARARAAAEQLENVEREAQQKLDAELAELEREHQAAVDLAKAAARSRVHRARSEHGNAIALADKAREAAEAARDRLLRLVPADLRESGDGDGDDDDGGDG